jgi:hypothetical protein
VTLFSVLQAMVMTLHASLIENSSNDQINSNEKTKVNLRLKNGMPIFQKHELKKFFDRRFFCRLKVITETTNLYCDAKDRDFDW